MSTNTTLATIQEDTTRSERLIKDVIEQRFAPLSGVTLTVAHDAGASDADNAVFTVTITDPAADGA